MQNGNIRKYRRLDHLKQSKYQTHRIFTKISENMSYEIFKYVNSGDLLEIRALKLGGYELISNTYLRARIKNYMKDKPIISLPNLQVGSRRINLLFEQKGERTLSFNSLKDKKVEELTQILKLIPKLETLNMSNTLP